MKTRFLKLLGVSTAILLGLEGCGGGGSSQSATVPSDPTPAAAPIPTPVATPSPTAPVSPGPTPAATVFAVVAVSPMVSHVLIDTSGDGEFLTAGDAATPTSLTGTFGRDVSVARPFQISGTIPATPSFRMLALGIDVLTGFSFGQMTAPAGATVISPLSSLIDAHGSEATIKNALGLSTGPFAVRPDLNLLTFDPVEGRRSSDPLVVADAARLTSINLQLLALAAVTKDTNGDPVDTSVTLREGSQYLAQAIKDLGTGRLSDKGVILAVLRKSRTAVGAPDDLLDAIATLLAKYFAAIPERLSDDASIRAWAYAYRFYVMPEARLLGSQWPNPATSRIAAISAADMRESATNFSNAVSPVTSDFVAVTDYRELSSSTITPYSLTMSGCTLIPNSPHCNDWELFQGTGRTAVITSVATGDPSALSVLLAANGDLTISRVGSFAGLTYFTYSATSMAGLVSTGKVYVRVRDRP